MNAFKCVTECDCRNLMKDNIHVKVIEKTCFTFVCEIMVTLKLTAVYVETTTTITAIEFPLSGSIPYTSTDKTKKNKYT
jgi:hypothetical protein